MLSKILQINRNFISTFIIILFSILIYLGNSSFLYSLKNLLPVVSLIFSTVILIYSINSTKYFKNNYFIFFYLLLCFAFYNQENTITFYAALLFLNIILNQLILFAKYGSGVLNAFDLGFFSGFIILFHPPFVIFILPMLIYFLVLGKVEVKKFLLNILGLIVFGILYFEIIIVFDWWFLFYDFVERLKFDLIRFNVIDSKSYLFFIPLLMFLGLGFLDYIKNLNRHSSDKKLVFLIATIYTIASILFIILWNGNIEESLIIFSFPVALFLSNFFTFKNKIIIKEIYLWVLIVSVLLFKYHELIVLPDFFDQVTF